MATFQKPENALRRAEELIGISKQQDALDTLHAAVQHKRFRNQWSQVIEDIICRHLQLCVELRKIRTAREALHVYRTTCQAANIGSLEKVVQKFRKAAEEKVNDAKKLKDLKMGQMEDLDEVEAPQTILLRAIQASDTRQQSQDRDVHEHFRFLWDTYKVILDVLKSNSRLEEVYHETAKHAFEFCRVNQRPQEFKRLCETLRKNFADLFKRSGSTPQHQVNPNSVETVNRTLDTRCRQLQVATELNLWRCAHDTAEDMMELMSKSKPKPRLRSMYYEYLGQIFWKSEDYLFHAFACLKNLLFVKAANQHITKQELQQLASKAVLAAICVPFQKTNEISATIDLTSEGATAAHTKAKKHTALFNAQSVPTRESIIAQLQEKGLVQLATDSCQKLFALIESDFTPLSLCQDAKPFLDSLGDTELCEGKLMEYVTPLKQIIFFRLTKQLSEVYASMTIENFEKAASIESFSIVEKWMANAAREQGISVQINYIQKAIVFGSARKVDMKSMRQPLIELGHKLQQAMYRVAPEEQQKKEAMEKQQIATNIAKRVEEETKKIRQRKEEIERRKEANERKREIQQREEMEKENRKAAREAEIERARQAEERKRREVEREEQKRRDVEMQKNRDILEQMKKQAEQRAVNLKVAGKKITEIEADDLKTIGFDQIEKARDAQLLRERQEKIRQRKLESKRIDHISRAMREEQSPLIDDWAHEVRELDLDFLDAAEEKNAAAQKVKHEEGLKEKEALLPFADAKDDWTRERLDARYDEADAANEERWKRCQQKVIELKIQRARERKAAHEAKTKEERKRHEREEEERKRREREEEERLEREEEEKLRAEQAELRRQREEAERAEREEKEREERERKKQEDEERAERRRKEQQEMQERSERAEAKRREREREMEEREQREKEERQKKRDDDRKRDDDTRGGGGGGGGWRDRAGASRGGRDDGDEGGTWRSGGPRRNAGRDDDDSRPSKPEGGSWRDRQAARDSEKGGDDWRRTSKGDDEGGRRDDRDWGRRDDRDGPRRDERDGPRRDDRDWGRRDDRDGLRRDDRDGPRRDDRDGPRRDDRDGPRRDDRDWGRRDDRDGPRRDDRDGPRRDDRDWGRRDDRDGPRRDDRDGPRRDDRDGPRRDDRDWGRRDDRDGPRRDDRDGPRRDDRDGPRRDDRDWGRRDDRDGPRRDDRDGPRRDDRDGPRRDDRDGPRKTGGRDDDMGSWRNSGPRRDDRDRDDRDDRRGGDRGPPQRRSDGEDTWRRNDNGPPRRDEKDGDAKERRPTPPWKRNKAAAAGGGGDASGKPDDAKAGWGNRSGDRGDRDDWNRKQGDRDDWKGKSGDRDDWKGRGGDRDDWKGKSGDRDDWKNKPREEPRGSAWKKDARDDAEDAPARKAPAAPAKPEPIKEEPKAAEPEQDDDGFTAVSNKKKGKKKQ